MKLLPQLLAASLLLAAVPASQALEKLRAVESAAEYNTLTWVNQYYLNPQPELVVKRAHILSEMGYFEQQGQPAQAVGFFAAIFAQHPAKVDGWIAGFRDLPVKHQRLLASAAWMAGNPRGATRLRELSAGADDASLAALLNGPAPSLSDTAVLSPSSMNLHWGAFLATGHESHIVAILAAAGDKAPGLAESARIALALNASQHERVLQICQAELEKQPKDVQELLRAALDNAAAKTPAS